VSHGATCTTSAPGYGTLALDLHYGMTLEAARATSWVVLGVSAFLTLVFGALIW
jgi:hypothetical protein